MCVVGHAARPPTSRNANLTRIMVIRLGRAMLAWCWRAVPSSAQLRHSCFLRAVARAFVVSKTKAFSELGWELESMEPVKNLVREHYTGILATQASEDSFNLAKNSKRLVKNMRYRTPERCFGVLLDKDVVGRVHRFKGVTPDEGLDRRSVKLSRDVFHSTGQDCSIPAKDIVGNGSRPKWYSAKPEDIGRSYAVAQLYLDAFRTQQPAAVEQAWLGAMCDASRRLLIRRKAEGSPWYFCLHHFSGSSVAVWLATLQSFSGYSMQFAEFSKDVDGIVLVSILDLQEWEALGFSWRSPTWQFVRLPKCRGSIFPAVRAVVDGAPQALQAVGAKAAFWSLGAPWLHKLAAHLGIFIESGSSLLEILLNLSTAILGVSEEQALRFAAHRVSKVHVHDAFSAALLEIDDVHDVLARDDVQVFEKQQVSSKARREERRSLEKEFHARAHAIRSSTQPPQKKSEEEPQGARRRRSPNGPPSGPHDIPKGCNVVCARGRLHMAGESQWRLASSF